MRNNLGGLKDDPVDCNGLMHRRGKQRRLFTTGQKRGKTALGILAE
jgi:hypothetical protein